MFRILIIAWIIFGNGQLCILNAQIRDDGGFGDDGSDLFNRTAQSSKGFDSLQIGKDPDAPDTLIFDSFTLRDITRSTPYTDTTLTHMLYYGDATRDPHQPTATIGNVGSASHTLLYRPLTTTSFEVGYHEYEIYNTTIDQFRFHKTNRAITDVYFGSTGNQQNISVLADFTRNFEDGIQLSINYQRLANEGFYNMQRVRHTNFGAGVWYQSESDKYNMFVSFISNVNTEEQNGGVSDKSVFGTEFAEFRGAIPTFLSEASTRHQQRGIRWSNFYKLASPDSAQWNLQLQYDLEYNWNYWNYDDKTTSTTQDTILYGPYLVDKRGARTYINDNCFQQGLYIYGLGPRDISGRVGLQYDWHRVSLADRDSTIHDLSLRFAANLPFINALRMETRGSLGLANNAGSFHVEGKVNLDIASWASLRGEASVFRRSVELTERTFWVNETRIYLNDFTKPFGSTLSGTIMIPAIHSQVGISQIIENNPIYWNDNALPTQLDGVQSITQMHAAVRLEWKGLHTDHYIYYQLLSKDIIDLPKYHSIHQLYWDGDLFKKKMNLRTGVQIRLTPGYVPQRFLPVTGEFYQGVTPTEIYPDLDYFLSFRVQSFRMFLQLENISNFWLGDDQLNYQVEDYPQFDWKIRYGIRWLLFD